MPTVLDRLREALAPDYEVEREIARGGMGMVFLAREVLLQRQVAIKVIRPELATARAAEKFLSEARILANLRHPNVIPVHRAEQTGGFFYYVMDYVEGETLADRLARGPLEPGAALKLGRDLLDALEAVHAMGVVHRDIKPSNILLIGGRAILTDFGIARPSLEPLRTAETQGRVVGTVGYMPPEQAYGWEVTARTDLFAVGVVLYEAYTGRRWGDQVPGRRPNWSGIPGKVVPVLRRALTWEPKERWPDATTFRHKLWKTRTHMYRRRTLLLTLGALVVGAVVTLLVAPRGGELHETYVGVLPFEPGEGTSDTLARRLTNLTEQNLEFFGDGAVAMSHLTDALWRDHGRELASIGSDALSRLGTRALVHATVTRDLADTAVTLNVVDSTGEIRPAGVVRMSGSRSLEATGHLIAQRVIAITHPNRQSEFRGIPLSDVDEALEAYLDGLGAFKRNAFEVARGHFEQALALDSTMGLASWWLSNSWRWLKTGEPMPSVDLKSVLESQRGELPELVRLLIEAQLAESQQQRIESYRRATERYPRDGYAAFLYAEELQTRGALVGVSLEEYTEQLEQAAAKDSTFGPSQYHLAWSYIRLGDQQAADASLSRFEQAAEDTVYGRLFRFLAQARFDPDDADVTLQELAREDTTAAIIGRAFRLGTMWDAAQTQVAIAEEIMRSGMPLARDTLAHLLEGRGLALIGLGRVSEGLQCIDSAATLFASDSARLEAAEWRVVASALGVPGIGPDEIEDGRDTLLALLAEPATRSRAAWALGVDAASRGDTVALRRWSDSLSAAPYDTVAAKLALWLSAIDRGTRGTYQAALEASEYAIRFDSAGRGGDPFARAVLHLKRAEWYDSLGRPDAADRERLWYEHFEFIAVPAGEAQAGEIDWALSTYARLLRARAARDGGDRDRACSYYERVSELWKQADSAYVPLRTEAEDYVRQRCR
ncbi:MAG: protein kinase [Gemmatimonadota bacterium]|nr:MAG: protein kinase [Gemmatimonadota bacterium]